MASTITDPYGTVSANATTSSNSIPLIPDWYNEALRTVAGQGASLLASPYEPYNNPRIAGLTPDQLSGQDLARQAAAGWALNPNDIQASANYGLSAFDPNEVNKYMSPFTTGVVNEIGRLGNQNLFENVLPGVNSTFQGAGQFGSSRNANFMNQAIRDNTYNTLGQQAQALQQAQQAGLNAYTQWHQNALGNAQQAATSMLGGANALNTIGTQNQQQQQQNYNLAYQDFQNQRDYGKNQLDWYNNLVRGLGNTATGTAGTSYNQNQGNAPSPLMQGLSAAANIYGTFK